MLTLIQRFYHDEQGVTGTEYAIMVVFVALALAVGAAVLGGDLSTLFSDVGGSLSSAKMPTIP